MYNAKTRPEVLKYIEERTIFEPNTGCLLWTAGACKDGYGKMYFESRHRRVHTVIFEIAHGPIPKGQLIQHTCDTPACCNLDHLVLGTPLSNMQDKVQKGRLRNQNMGKTHCMNGHEFTVENTYTDPQGRRDCVQCRREKRGVKKTGPAIQTHCKRGHEFTPENTRVYGNVRHCKACARLRPYKPRKPKRLAR